MRSYDANCPFCEYLHSAWGERSNGSPLIHITRYGIRLPALVFRMDGVLSVHIPFCGFCEVFSEDEAELTQRDISSAIDVDNEEPYDEDY